MKIFSRASLILFLFVSFLISTHIANSEENRYGGSLVHVISSDPKTFNGILSKDATSSSLLGLIFEGLTTTNPFDSTDEPHLATHWDVSEDGTQWIFYLRKDVFWSDGHPFTADDVVFTFNELIYNEEIPSSAGDIFTIEGQRFKVDKIDDLTVRFTLPLKFAPFLKGMGQPIYPKHILQKHVQDKTFNYTWGIDTLPNKIIGTGAYMLEKYDPGQRIVFKRNPNYWKLDPSGQRLPYIDKIIYMIVQNADVELLKFLEGSVDVYGFRGMDYPLLKPLEKEKNFTVYDLGPATGSNFLTFNQNNRLNPHTSEPYLDSAKLSWFRDLEFRRAVAHAVDRDKIIEIVKNGLGYPQHSPIGPGAGFFHNPDVKEYEYNLKKAKDILLKAGYVDRDNNGYIEDASGHQVEFSLYTNADNTERIDIASIIRFDLEKLGMKVNLKPLEFNTMVGKLTSSYDWDAMVIGLTGGIEPHFGKNVWDSSGQLHMWNPAQEEPETEWETRVNDLFNLGVQELNPDVRKTYYDEFQQIVSQQLPVIYTVLSAKITALRNKFGNIKPAPFGGVLHNLEEIYILPEFKN